MISTDHEILISIQGEIHALKIEQSEQGKRITRIESRLDSLDARVNRIESRLDKIETRFDEQDKALIMIHEELAVQGNSIEMLSREIGLGFGGVALVIALVGVFVPMYITRRKEDSPRQDNGQSILKDVAELFKLMRGDKTE